LPVRSKAKAGGRRRNPTNWSYTGVSLPTYTNRGFTGHEHLDMFELIHMLSEAKSREQSEAGNGRVYDPKIAQFLSPDPVIQDPYSIFSYNRYSYCLNNPLKYTDPLGLTVADKQPEMEVINPGWLKYVPYGVYSGLYNDYEIGPTGGGGNIVEIEGVYWDKDAKAYRNKKDGHLLSEAEYLAYINLLLNEAANGGGTWDPITNDRISQLHSDVQGPATNFINQVESELGIQLRVTQGLRTFAEQNALYAKGRTAPGSIVTNAQGGQSYHNYGLAIDVVEINNGRANWNTNWSAISEIGIRNGFEWGGNFRSISDNPHFQMTFGYSTTDLLNLYNSGQW